MNRVGRLVIPVRRYDEAVAGAAFGHFLDLYGNEFVLVQLDAENPAAPR